MSINTNIYGSDWVNDFHDNAKTTNVALWNYVLDDTFILNSLPDVSPCYCGMYSDNYLINAVVCRQDKTFKPLYKNDKSVNTWFLMRNYANPPGAPNGQNIDGYPIINRWAKWDTKLDLPNYYAEYSNHFLFNIKLNQLLFVPYVVCSANSTFAAETTTYTLGAYESTEHTTHPYINGVCMVCYYNDGTDESPDWTVVTNSTDNYIFTTPIAELSNDIQALSANFVAAFSLISSTVGRSRIPIMGFGETPTRDLSDTGNIYNPIGLDPEPTHYIYNDNDNPTKIKYCRQYSESAIKDIYKQIAYYGVFFVGAGAGDFTSLTLTDNRVFCGTIAADGITYGDYTRGPDNAEQPQYSWDDTSDSPYDPSKEVDPNKYNGSMNINTLQYFDTVTNRYSLSALSYSQLTNKLWDILENIPADTSMSDYCLDSFLTTNPIDNIVSLKYFPLADDTGFGTGIHVFLGKYDTTISAYKAHTVIEHSCGAIQLFPKYGDWRDYETQVMLYLPFCGTINIDPKIYMGRYIYVDYVVDIITGNCSAAVYVYADNGNKCIIEIANGNCAIDLPVTGIEQMTLQGQMYNATEQLKQLRVNNSINELSAAIKIGGSIVSANVGNVANSILQTATMINNQTTTENIAEYEIEHMAIPTKMIGTTGSVTGACMELYPTIIYLRPTIINDFNESNYAHSIGYATCKPVKIGNVSGYAEFTNVDLSGFAATATEKKMIADALSNGVYL